MIDYESIADRCKKGNSKAQMDFYRFFSGSVYNSAFRILGASGEAEEVMQETFLKIFCKPELMKSDATEMRKTLNRIAINHSIDIYRKRKVFFVELGSEDEYPGEEEDDQEVWRFKLEAIKKNIPLLSDGYRIVLSLHLLEEMDYSEIAEKLNLSSSTVRSQYTRARQKLLKLISKNNDNETIDRG